MAPIASDLAVTMICCKMFCVCCYYFYMIFFSMWYS